MKTKEEIIKEFSVAQDGEHREILSNDIKKGDLIREINGWYGEIMDNLKGNTRCANIHGFCEEAGSIYVWDIAEVCKGGLVYKIKLTNKQKKNRKMVSAMGF
ncbi:hypothetical protein ES708_18714 [subsurface metagenome]